MSFLAGALREGEAFKCSIVDVLCDIVLTVPESHETGVAHLCEFIEYCEFPPLTIKVMHLLASLASSLSRPDQVVRFIYNRVLPESSIVRAAAVESLSVDECS